MKDKIDTIFYDLDHEIITEKQAHQQMLDLFMNCFSVDDIKLVYELGRSAGKKKNMKTSEEIGSAFLRANKLYFNLKFE
jgi:hypothetical protein